MISLERLVGFAFLICVTLLASVTMVRAYDDRHPLSCGNDPNENPNYTGPFDYGTNTIVDRRFEEPFRIYYFRMKAEVSRISLCAGRLATGRWFQFLHTPTLQKVFVDIGAVVPEGGPGEVIGIRHVSNRVRLTEPFSIHDPWNGVVRYDFPWGVLFRWYDSAGPNDPNTDVYFCVGSAAACPPEAQAKKPIKLPKRAFRYPKP